MAAPTPLGSVYHVAVAEPGSVGDSGLALATAQGIDAAHEVMREHLPDPLDPQWCGWCERERHPCGLRCDARALLVGEGRLVLADGHGRRVRG